MVDILAVISHPDDETFGCGGTLALHAEKGDGVKVLCLTCNPNNRRKELQEACYVLGISEPLVLEVDEVKFSKTLIKYVADILVAEKPRIVITHTSFDYHSEHRVTHQVVKESIEWAAHMTTYENPWLVSRLLLMEVNTLIPSPDIYLDITKVMKKKMDAVQHYISQLSKFPWGYYKSFTEKKAELRGIQANCQNAEAFIEESIPKNSPFYLSKATSNLLR
jgi:LmbE family N-acetylglucosaminyl deacetylase